MPCRQRIPICQLKRRDKVSFCSLLRSPRSRRAMMVAARPGLNAILLEHLSAQIRRLTERVFEFSTLAVRDRLIHELLRLAEATGMPEG